MAVRHGKQAAREQMPVVDSYWLASGAPEEFEPLTFAFGAR